MSDSGAPPEPVLEVPAPQEIKILETAEDIQVRISFSFFFSLFYFLASHKIVFSFFI